MGSLDREALEIVEACLELAGPDRARLLDERCARSERLREQVERMLAMDSTEHRFAPTEGPLAAAEPPQPLPERIGHYRITGVIGRGGMGTVVRAERDDGVYAQTVAIKLTREEIRDTRARERFALERRILARLSHPGIARILDGGEVDGRPYLVMEHIEGGPVTDRLDRGGAGLAETLRTFEAICEAVGHAHRNLVVHGDLKPSNVLAAEDGTVKLVDFGVARLTAGLADEEIDGPSPMTRGYAAPERLAGAPPTVASDVFSLGALLHELLTGELPDPDGQPMSDFAAGRSGRVPAKQLQGDLDAIVAKAIAAAPDGRYPDVAELIEDLRRHRAHLPVLARAGGRGYRAGRFIVRHRAGLAITGLVGLLLIAATLTSVSLYLQSERARGEAEQRFGEVRGLARFMLFDLYDQLVNAPGTVPARVRIAETTGRYLDRLRRVPDAPADLRLDSAIGYRRLATVQGLSGTSSLGKSSVAKRSIDTAEQLLWSVLAERPRDAAALEEMGWVLQGRWTILEDSADSPATNRASRRFFDAALAVEPGRSRARLGRLTTDKSEGYELIYSADQPAKALPILRNALASLRAARFAPADREDARLLEVNLMNRIGDATYYAGDMAGALPFYREANAIIDRQLARGETVQWLDRRGEAMFNISGTLTDMGGDRDEALAAARLGIKALNRVLEFGPDALAEKRLLILYGQETHVLTALGRKGEALDSSSRRLALAEKQARAEPGEQQRGRTLAMGLTHHGDVLAAVGERQEACRAVRRAAFLWEEMRRRAVLSALDDARNVPLARQGIIRHCS